MQVGDEDRADESAFNKVFVRAKSGKLVPLSSVGYGSSAKPGRRPSITPGSLRRSPCLSIWPPGLRWVTHRKKIVQYRAQLKMPASVLTAWGGDAAAFQSSQGSQVILIVAALLVIYVLLGVLYESYHPSAHHTCRACLRPQSARC